MEEIPIGQIEVTYEDAEGQKTEVVLMKDYNKGLLVKAIQGKVKIISVRCGQGDPICVSGA